MLWRGTAGRAGKARILSGSKDNRPGPGQVSARFDVEAALAPARRSIGLRRIGKLVSRGAGGGAAAGILVLGIARIYPFRGGLPGAFSALCAGAVVGLIVGLRRWPSSLEAARAADVHFALRDRLTTALELKSSNDTFPLIQRLEAAGRLEGLRLGGSARVGVRWQEALAVALAMVGFLALLTFAGAPSVGSARTTSVSDALRIHTAATIRLPALQRNIEGGLIPRQLHNSSLRKLDVALSHLQAQLLQSPSRTAALRSVSLTQQQLHRLAASLHPITPQAAAQLDSALAGYIQSKQRSIPLPNGNALAAASLTLSRLARALNHMTPVQRDRLARALARESNETSDSTLRLALQQAASSLAGGDPRTAAASLNEATAALRGSPSAAAAQARLNAADGRLDLLKYEISGLTGEAAPSPGSSAQAAKSGADRRATDQANGSNTQASGSGSAAGHGNGRAQGHGSGAGRGSGNGSRIAAGQTGSGGTGGHGTSGGRESGPSPRRGRYATVYSPFQEKTGPRTFQLGPNGRPELSGLIPYQLVIGQYRRSARAALDRSSLTPAQQATVRTYFSSISR